MAGVSVRRKRVQRDVQRPQKAAKSCYIYTDFIQKIMGNH